MHRKQMNVKGTMHVINKLNVLLADKDILF